MQDLTDLLEKLSQLRAADSALTRVGAVAHQYRLGSPLTDEAVQHVEVRHHITFLVDYRGFLLQVGNGGAGPAYGLASLEAALITSPTAFWHIHFPTVAGGMASSHHTGGSCPMSMSLRSARRHTCACSYVLNRIDNLDAIALKLLGKLCPDAQMPGARRDAARLAGKNKGKRLSGS
jgi:hypothetical protein